MHTTLPFQIISRQLKAILHLGLYKTSFLEDYSYHLSTQDFSLKGKNDILLHLHFRYTLKKVEVFFLLIFFSERSFLKTPRSLAKRRNSTQKFNKKYKVCYQQSKKAFEFNEVFITKLK